MTMFTINHATQTLFGNGASNQTGAKLKALGCKKVICVYDPGVKAAGIAAKIVDNIKASDIEVVEFGEVEADPPLPMAERAGELARKEQVDGIVGLGGGSSMDTAKAVAIMACNPGALADYAGANIMKPKVKNKPLVLISTTSGTSAEVTPASVLTDANTGAKTGVLLRADLAIVDPDLTLGVPPFVTASTGIDMLSHVTESFTNPMVHWMSDLIDEKVIETVFKYLPIAVKDGANIEARTKLAFACNAAGYAFADNGTHIGHVIADCFSKHYHFAHGIGCSFGLPITIKNAALVCPDKVRQIAKLANISIPEGSSDQAVGELVASGYRQLMRGIGLKSMQDMGVEESKIEEIIKEVPLNGRFRNNPNAPDFEKIATFLRSEFQAG